MTTLCPSYLSPLTGSTITLQNGAHQAGLGADRRSNKEKKRMDNKKQINNLISWHVEASKLGRPSSVITLGQRKSELISTIQLRGKQRQWTTDKAVEHTIWIIPLSVNGFKFGTFLWKNAKWKRSWCSEEKHFSVRQFGKSKKSNAVEKWREEKSVVRSMGEWSEHSVASGANPGHFLDGGNAAVMQHSWSLKLTKRTTGGRQLHSLPCIHFHASSNDVSNTSSCTLELGFFKGHQHHFKQL